MANRGEAVRYRSISGLEYDAVLTKEPWDRGEEGLGCSVEVTLPGVKEPVTMHRVEWVEREPPRIIVCVAWPKEAEHGEAKR